MNKKKWALPLLLSIVVLIVPWMGAEPLSLRHLFITDSLTHRLFWELRIPRLLVTLALGGVLASIGSVYQSIFKNPLCDPYVLGISSAGLLGLVLGGGVVWGMGSAMILVALLMLFSLSQKRNPDRVLLFGMGMNFFLSSVLFVFLSLQSENMGGGTLKWFFGFLPWVSLEEGFGFVIAGLLSLALLTLFSRGLDVLRLGDSVSKTLGVQPLLFRNSYLLMTSLLVGLTVSLSGTIGFVGLVVPQVCRMIFKPQSMASLISLSFLVGAGFLSFADGLSRSVLPPFEFPVGIMTTLLGGPIFLLLLWRKSS